MEKKIISLLLFCLLHLFANGQDILDEGNLWIYSNVSFSGSSYSYSLKVGRDSLMPDNFVYKNLERKNASDTTGTWIPTDTWLREEDKRLYRWEGGVIMDMNAEVGDTLNIEAGTLSDCDLTITAEDSITLKNGEKRRYFALIAYSWGWQTDYWVEGMGNQITFLNYGDVLCATDVLEGLRCFVRNDSLLWGNFETAEDCYYFNIPTQDISPPQSLSIYPNPTTGHLLIQGDLPDISLLECFNAHGRHLIKSDAYTGELDISHLPKGIYFIRLTDGNGRQYMGKVVKTGG